MTTTRQGASGGWFSKLVVVLLLALAVGLYLRIVMVDGGMQQASAPASVRVVEGEAASGPSAADEASDEGSELEALPAEQMELVRRVFAPELAD
jgi:hypothetical protein